MGKSSEATVGHVAWDGSDVARVDSECRPGRSTGVSSGRRAPPSARRRAPRATGRHHRRRADGGRVGMTRSVNHDRGSVWHPAGASLAKAVHRHVATAMSPPPVATTSRHHQLPLQSGHHKLPPQEGPLGPRASSAESIRRANSCGRVRPIGRRAASASPAPAALCWSRSDYLVGGSSQLFDGSSVIFSAHSQHSAALANSFSARKTLPKCCHRVASGLSADHVRRDHRRRRRRVGGAAGPTVSP